MRLAVLSVVVCLCPLFRVCVCVHVFEALYLHNCAIWTHGHNVVVVVVVIVAVVMFKLLHLAEICTLTSAFYS